MIRINVTDSGVQQVLNDFIAGLGNTGPLMRAIGEDIIAASRRSFESSTSPDGEPWAPNTEATYLSYLGHYTSSSRKDGKLSSRGADRAMSKKPLIGQSRDLSRQFHYNLSGDMLTVYNSMVYAAMQHFGGQKSEFPHLWGDIPARPIMPIDSSGNLSPAGMKIVSNAVDEFIKGLA